MLMCGLAATTSAQIKSDKEQKPTVQEKDDNKENEKLSPEDRKQIKISAEQARKIALEKVSGSIVEEEIEKENGFLI